MSANEIRVISRGDGDEAQGRRVYHIEKVFVEFPPGLPAGMSDAAELKRDVLIFQDNKNHYGVYDKGAMWWFDNAYGVEEVLAAYLTEIIRWGAEADSL